MFKINTAQCGFLLSFKCDESRLVLYQSMCIFFLVHFLSMPGKKMEYSLSAYSEGPVFTETNSDIRKCRLSDSVHDFVHS